MPSPHSPKLESRFLELLLKNEQKKIIQHKINYVNLSLGRFKMLEEIIAITEDRNT